VNGDSMRLRKVHGAKDLIAKHREYIIDNLDNEFIDLKSLFKNDNPIQLEIGMGKGQFIYTLAENNKDINYIGVERFDSVIVRALEKVIDNPLPNLMLIRTDATDLSVIFDHHLIDRIYLNFSDPWPKDRHAKRRLTNKRFLSMYEKLLIKGKELHFKTDNKPLFDYSVDEVLNYPMDMKYVNYDLHNSDYEGNIMTEFEERFSKLGNKINKLTATFKEDNNG
jgi:tRNA (guanine-N7-)-methyltransferase